MEKNQQKQSQQDRNSLPPTDMPNKTGVDTADMTTQTMLHDTRLQNHLAFPSRDDEQEQAKPKCSGCPDDKKMTKNKLEDIVKQEAIKNNLDYNDPKQKREAHMKVLGRFRHEYRLDKASKPQDKEGSAIAPGPDFIIKDGGIYYPEYGKSLQELLENTKRVQPELYDEKQHATLTMVERAFVNGATIVSHVSHHMDGGKEAIRDQIILRWNPDTQKGTMEIRNIALDGNFHSIEEAIDIMGTTLPGATTIHPVEGVGIITDVALNTETVSSVLKSHTVGYEYDYVPSVSESVIGHTRDTIRLVGTNIHDEAMSVMRDIGEYRKKKNESDIIVPEYLQRLLDVSEIKQQQDEIEAQTTLVKILDGTHQEHQPALTMLTNEPEVNSENNMDVVEVWKKKAMDVLHITPKQAEVLVKHIEKTVVSMEKAKDSISFSILTGVGIGGALRILDVLTLPVVQEEQQNVEIPVTETITEKNIEHGNVLHEFITMLAADTGKVKISEQTVQEQPDDVDASLTERFILFFKSIRELPKEKQRAEIIKEQEQVAKRMLVLWEAVQQLIVQKIDNIFEKESIVVVSEEVKTEQQTVEQFSLAVSIWMMLRMVGYFRVLETMKQVFGKTEAPKHTPGIDSNTSIETIGKTTEAILQKEETPWLLFAIIWTLAMIREQGMAQSTQPVQQSYGNGKRKKLPAIPDLGFPQSYGVIFAFSS